MAFDLRADVAEIPRETDATKFTFDLKLAKEVRELRAAEKVDEALLAQKEADLAAATYVAELASVPRRRREDIYEESVTAFPAKLSLIQNHVDEGTQLKRNSFVRIELVTAATQSITKGGVDRLDDRAAIRDAIQFIYEEAPDQIWDILETKVSEMNKLEDEQDALNKSADF